MLFVLPRHHPPYLWHRGVLMEILNPDDDDIEIISLWKQEATTKYAENFRIRVKIKGKYYVGHLEMSE